MDNDFHRMDTTGTESGTLKSYVLGFLLSVLLTVGAYLVVAKHLFTSWVLVFAIVGLGSVQALIQLVFFLHLGKESKPRWNLLVFFFMGLVVAILVIGSLWIMYNLNYRVMPKI
jgi:cytochrome o ubiquinol oxidase operon protein cyoD